MPENILGRAFLVVKEAGSFLKEWTGGIFYPLFRALFRRNSFSGEEKGTSLEPHPGLSKAGGLKRLLF